MTPFIYKDWDHKVPDWVDARLKSILTSALEKRGEVKIFFRADDIAVPSKNFYKLMDLFLNYRQGLCLAVVPTWLTRQRWEAISGYAVKGKDIFCWHLHGYRHKNHESEGKKQEFGSVRPKNDLASDLIQGFNQLVSIIGEQAFPVFTPPWNRCSKETLVILRDMKFKAVSRSYGAIPESPDDLNEFPVHVDLHTRKDPSAEIGWENLMSELQIGLEDKICGIMIHHMKMNDQAFILLEYLLNLFSQVNGIEIVTFSDLC